MADQAPGGAGGWGAGQPGGQQQWGAGANPVPPPQAPTTWGASAAPPAPPPATTQWGAGYTPPPAQPGAASPWHTVWKALLIIVTLLYLVAIVGAFIGGTNLANQVGFDWAGANIGSGSVGMAFAIIVAAVFFIPWALVSLVLFLLMSATRAPSAPVVFSGGPVGYQPTQGYGYAPPQGYAPPPAYVPPAPQPYPSAPPPQAAGPAKSCPRCGAVVPYDAASCPSCGYSPGA